jgi:DNA-binding transcriptional LysR family regulator
MQIRKLREAVGTPLFDQIGKAVHLTDAGHALYRACREVFEAFERLDTHVADVKGLKRGTIRLAVVTTAKYFAPIMLGRFCERYPGIDVALKVTNRERLLERMAENADDFYIIGQPPPVAGAEFEPFMPNPLVIVAWPGHPLARRRSIDPEQLAGERFIMREPGSGTRLAIIEHLNRHNLAPTIRMELGSNEAIKQAVMGKLGISILSRHAVASDLRAGRLVLLNARGFPLRWDWHIGYSAQRKLSLLARTFLDYVRKDGRKIVDEISG